MKKTILIVILFLFSLIIIGCGNNTTTGDFAADTEDYVKIPISELSNNVKFYSYDDNGVEIRYFAVLGSDGEPRTAFDACDVCGGYKGYEQKGNDIVCRNCGKVFNIDGLGTQNKGYGCWPSYLPHKIQGKDILININDIKEGKKRFV